MPTAFFVVAFVPMSPLFVIPPPKLVGPKIKMPAAETPLAVMLPLLVMPPVTMPVILIAFRMPVPGIVAWMVPVFWIAPLRVVTTVMAAVEVPPPEMALLMLPELA